MNFKSISAVVKVIENGENVDVLIGNNDFGVTASGSISGNVINITFSDDIATSYNIKLPCSCFGKAGGGNVPLDMNFNVPYSDVIQFWGLDSIGNKGDLTDVVFAFEFFCEDTPSEKSQSKLTSSKAGNTEFAQEAKRA